MSTWALGFLNKVVLGLRNGRGDISPSLEARARTSAVQSSCSFEADEARLWLGLGLNAILDSSLETVEYSRLEAKPWWPEVNGRGDISSWFRAKARTSAVQSSGSVLAGCIFSWLDIPESCCSLVDDCILLWLKLGLDTMEFGCAETDFPGLGVNSAEAEAELGNNAKWSWLFSC